MNSHEVPCTGSPSVDAPDGKGAENRHAARMADAIAGRLPAILREYRQALRDKGSVLCEPPHWGECAWQAEGIVDDCVAALRDVWEQPDDNSLSKSGSLGRNRAFHGVHPAYSFHACTVLFETVLNHFRTTAAEFPRAEADMLLMRALHAYNSSVGHRVQSAMQGYDAFLLTEVRNANSEDRLQLSRDIHDHLGSSLAMTLRCLELHEAQELDGPAGQRLNMAYSSLREALAYARSLVGELRIATPRAGLESSLREFLDSAHFVTPKTRIHVSGDEQWVARTFREELFVILRECLRNSFNHAEASMIGVNVDIAPHEVYACVEDDGKGFDVPEALASGTASGLSSIRERTVGLGGRADWTSAPGRGTRVTLRIPYARNPVDTVQR